MRAIGAFRKCSRGGCIMNTAASAVAKRMQFIVRDAAMPVAPGDKIKAQVNRAWANLGRPRLWRVIAAWKGEAGCWSGAATYEFEQRYAAWRERQARRAAELDLTHAARLEATASALEIQDEAFHRTEIARLRDVARVLRNLGGNRDVAVNGEEDRQ